MCCTIIVCCIIGTHYGHNHRYRVHCLPTIRHFKNNIIKIAVGIGKLAGVQIHISSSRIGSGSLSCTTESEIVHSIERIADGYFVSTNTMFCTIIIRSILMTRNGHDY